MIVKNEKIYDLRHPAVFQALASIDVPAKVGYRLGKLITKLQHEIRDISTSHQKLLDKYGKPKDDSSGQYDIAPEHLEAFNKEFTDLLSLDVDMGLDKVQLPGDTKIGIPLLLSLDEFIEVVGE